MPQQLDDEVGDPLDNEDNQQDQDGADQSDIRVEAVEAVADGDLSQSSCSNGSGHGCEPDEADHGDSTVADQGFPGFWQIDIPDDVLGPKSHGFGSFHDAFFHAGQGVLDLAGKKRNGGYRQGNDGGRIANGSASQKPCQLDHDGNQDDKGDGSSDVHNLVQDGIEGLVFQDAVFLCDRKNDADENAEDRRDGSGCANHVQGGDGFDPDHFLDFYYIFKIGHLVLPWYDRSIFWFEF